MRSAFAELLAAPADTGLSFLQTLMDYNERQEENLRAGEYLEAVAESVRACRPMSINLYQRATEHEPKGFACNVVAHEAVPAQTVGVLVWKSWAKAFRNISAMYLDFELLSGQLVKVIYFEKDSYDFRHAPLHYLYALDFSVSGKGYLNVSCQDEPEPALEALTLAFPEANHSYFYDFQAWQSRSLCPVVIEPLADSDLVGPAETGPRAPRSRGAKGGRPAKKTV